MVEARFLWIVVHPDEAPGLFRDLCAVSLHRDLVGEDAYEAAVDELVAGLAERLAPPECGPGRLTYGPKKKAA